VAAVNPRDNVLVNFGTKKLGGKIRPSLFWSTKKSNPLKPYQFLGYFRPFVLYYFLFYRVLSHRVP